MAERYYPESIGGKMEVNDILLYVERELRRVSIALGATLPSELPELHVAPSKPRTGMIVLADGTDWNPGSGQGVYAYYNGAWNFLG